MPAKFSNNTSNKCNNIFLEGSHGVGKSTLIIELCKELGLKCTGFMSLRMIDENAQSKGFYLEYFQDVTSSQILYSNSKIDKNRIHMEFVGERKIINIQAFENKNFFCDMEQLDCFVMDEIGGFELLCTNFKEQILKVLKSDILCIGAIKSDDNFLLMKEKVAEDMTKVASIREEIKQNIEIIKLTNENRNQIKSYLTQAIHRNK